MHNIKRVILLILFFLTLTVNGLAVFAQENTRPPIEVYVMQTPPDAEASLARLFFIDSLTGNEVTTDVRGDHFTVLGGYIIYQDPDTGNVFRTWPDGRTEPHPFIQPAPETAAIEWVVSPDQNQIAWTLINHTVENSIATVTTLARADGTEPRVILADGPDAFFQVKPLAITNDEVFFFDRQPTGANRFFFYPQYASVHRLMPDDSQPRLLPFEPNCFCGAGLSSNGQFFARLEQVSDEGGFEVRIWDLVAVRDVLVPMLPVPPLPYEMAGGVLVSPDGQRAVYSLANGLSIDSAGTGRERFMVAIADVGANAQRPAFETQLRVPLLPFAWTADNEGVLLYNPRQDGTWKLIIETGEVVQVAAATFVGVME